MTILSSRSGRNDLESQRDAEMDILIDNDNLYFGHYQGNLVSINKNTGNINWSSPFSFDTNIVFDNQSIFGSSTDNYILSIDKNSGFLNWKSKYDKTGKITQPIIIKDFVIIFDTNENLIAIDKKNGSVVEIFDSNIEVNYKSNILSYKDSIYILSIDGRLSKFTIN